MKLASSCVTQKQKTSKIALTVNVHAKLSKWFEAHKLIQNFDKRVIQDITDMF